METGLKSGSKDYTAAGNKLIISAERAKFDFYCPVFIPTCSYTLNNILRKQIIRLKRFILLTNKRNGTDGQTGQFSS